jgi:tetratricopeptide (TPR) repeat protein
MRRVLALLLVLSIAAALVWQLRRGGGQGQGPENDPTRVTPDSEAGHASADQTLARDRIAAMVSKEDWAGARRVLASLVSGEHAAFADLITATVLELKALEPPEKAKAYLDRARLLQPEAAVVAFLDGRLADLEGDLESAAANYRLASQRAPQDPASRYLLAAALENMDEDGTLLAEAVDFYKQLEARGIDDIGPWYVSAVYRLFQVYGGYIDDPEQERRYVALWESLDSQGHQGLRDSDFHEGELARILPPPPIGNPIAGPVHVPTFVAAELLAPELGGGSELLALDLDGDRQVDLASAGPNGVWVVLRNDVSGAWLAPVQVHPAPARLLRAIDISKDDSLDLIFVSDGALTLYECEGEADAERWVPSTLKLPSFPEEPADLALVDADHDGDLDLLLAGAFGARLLRNDGAALPEIGAARGGFVEAGVEAGLPDGVAFTWCATEDLDGDQDVDLILGGPESLWVGSNLRGGRFEDVAQDLFGDLRLGVEPLWLDANGDARPDALAQGSPATLLVQNPGGTFTAQTMPGDVPLDARPIEADLDLDGRVDALWADAESAARGLFALGLADQTLAAVGDGPAIGPLAIADLNNFDRALVEAPTYELLRLTAEGVRVYRADDVGAGIRIRFRGRKDNRQGIGAVVEVRAGAGYRRHYYRGATTIYGIGQANFADVLRITWPNGVYQNDLDVEKGTQILEGSTGLGQQNDNPIGSCPFLYTWNGQTFEFITDVLGITPLGLPMAPGQLVVPDHDEYVLVKGEQLVPNEAGELVLQFTEELREVTYLDRVRLDVIDHPADHELQPNELFCFPPFPEPRAHMMHDPQAPLRATGSDGQDWTAALAAVDDVHAAPFEPLRDSQFRGLAPPHWLELEFDPARLAGDGELRLICTGWFFWTNASANVAAARTPGIDFVPPVIEVPVEGGWRPIGPPVGFPAGKTKSMVIDLTEVLNREDPRLRIGSTLRLYWDSIRLATGEDGPLRTTSLEPTAGKLWPRGFSEPLESADNTHPLRFDWEQLAPRARWNQHPGRYTRFGEVQALLGSVDDMYVVMGSGDALTITFDASDLPPLPRGWRRDYLVFLDGWAKDRDPNTVEALNVEPLPFHGMSGYPYGSDEAFPDTAAHREWKQEWQTRPAFESVVPLSPTRLEEWAASTFER